MRYKKSVKYDIFSRMDKNVFALGIQKLACRTNLFLAVLCSKQEVVSVPIAKQCCRILENMINDDNHKRTLKKAEDIGAFK